MTLAPEMPVLSPEPFTSLPGLVTDAQWRVTLHARAWAAGSSAGWKATQISELPHARGRRLEQQLNKAAQFTFTLDGRNPAAALIKELQHDVIAWRRLEGTNTWLPYFRGPITQSEDQLTEQGHVVTFTAHDYMALVARRFITAVAYFNANGGSDALVVNVLLPKAIQLVMSSGFAVGPPAWMPLAGYYANGDGSNRGTSGSNGPWPPQRSRTYPGGTNIGTAIDELAALDFDWDVVPGWRFAATSQVGDYADAVRLFYPAQGVTRADPVLEYGGLVASLTRTLTSVGYSNYVRSVGNNQSGGDVTAPQLWAEAYNSDATSYPGVGTWMDAENFADVQIQQTLTENTQGVLRQLGTLTPSYTLKIRPGSYVDGLFNMGDTLSLVIKSGRLNVNTPARIVGLAFIADVDGTETVEVTVGKPPAVLADQWAALQSDVDALTRR